MILKLLMGCAALGLIAVIALALTKGDPAAAWGAIAYVGQAFALLGDLLAMPFAMVGINNPVVGWTLLGMLLGATAGAAHASRVCGRPGRARTVVLVGVACLLLLALLGITARDRAPGNPSASPTGAASPGRPAASRTR